MAVVIIPRTILAESLRNSNRLTEIRYPNFDCNLRCSYYVAESSPRAERRALGLDSLKRLVDEAVALGFREVFLTGGEPFILEDIYDMVAYTSRRLPTTVLTNGMLLKGRRLAALQAVANYNLTIQISLG